MFTPPTHKEEILQMVYARITFTLFADLSSFVFLRIIQSEHMWNIATSLHSLINPDRQKNAGGIKSGILVFPMVKTKSGNSSPFEQQMPVRLEHKLLDESVSHVKYQMLTSNVFGNKLKVSIP